MKKYLNKALIYKEWKAVYWILIPLVFFSSRALEISNAVDLGRHQQSVAVFVGYDMLFRINEYNYVTIGLVMLMAYLIMNNDRRESTKNLIEYMPFNIRQRIVSKLVVGEFIIFLSCLMGFIINTIMYKGNANYLSRIMKFQFIIWHLVIYFLLYSVIYFLFVYVQCFCRNGIFGTVLAASILMLPGSLEDLIDYFIHAEDVIYKFDALVIRYYLELPINYGFDGKRQYVKSYNFLPATIKLIVILAVLCMLFILFIKRERIGEGMQLKISPKKEKAFKIFSSVSIGILAAKSLSRLLNAQQSLTIYVILLNIVFIAAAYFAYSEIDKVIKLSKYDRGE